MVDRCKITQFYLLVVFEVGGATDYKVSGKAFLSVQMMNRVKLRRRYVHFDSAVLYNNISYYFVFNDYLKSYYLVCLIAAFSRLCSHSITPAHGLEFFKLLLLFVFVFVTT